MLSAIAFLTLATPGPLPSIVPKPVSVVPKPGVFSLLPSTVVVCDEASRPVAEMFAAQFRQSTGFPLRVSTTKPVREYIEFVTKPELKFVGEEGYRVNVRTGYVSVRGFSAKGVFYGMQSLRQMLPPQGESSTQVGAKWDVPGLDIEDYPRFKWRGMHLDVSRHFFSKDQIKQYIDTLALNKMNVFHWHLVDDGGWRIEIKKYPDLTRVGAWRTGDGSDWNMADLYFTPNDGTGQVYGGFYTQQDIKEIVKYASDRAVTVVPEIEMPGHALPALWAYREVGCDDAAVNAVLPEWHAKYTNVFCAGKEETFKFIENVLAEVMQLFPSKVIHIGGDEVDRRVWGKCSHCRQRMVTERLDGLAELQSYFVRRIEKHLNSKGRTLIGWDEILDGGLAPNATVMSWRGEEGGIKAAQAGHNVVMSPTSHCYFDFAYSMTPLEKVYAYEPVPASLTAEQAKHVLGAQGNVWTEWMETYSRVQWMSQPRGAALAEVLWSPKSARNFADFTARLKALEERYDLLGIEYQFPAPVLTSSFTMFRDTATINLSLSVRPGQNLRYTLDGTVPTSNSPMYTRPINVTRSTTIKVASFSKFGRGSEPSTASYVKAGELFSGAVRSGWVMDTYEGSFSKLPDFGKLEPVKSEVVPFIDIARAGIEDQFAVVYRGFINIPEDGRYAVALTSDDGSQLWIGGALALDHDGLHGPETKTGFLTLLAGLHPIEVRFFEQGGAQTLRLELAREGYRLNPVPDSWIFHEAK